MRITKTISLHHGMEKQWGDRGRDGKDGKVANVECYLSIPSQPTPPPPPTSSLHRDDRRIYKTNPDVVSQDKREKKKIYRLAESDPAATSLDR